MKVKLQDELTMINLKRKLREYPPPYPASKNKILMDRLTEGGKKDPNCTENDHTLALKLGGTNIAIMGKQLRVLFKGPCCPGNSKEFSSIPIKISMIFSQKWGKTILKFIWKLRVCQIAKIILRKHYQRLPIPDFKTSTQSYGNHNSMVLV